MSSYRIDIDALFKALGGITQVAYVLGKMGVPVGALTPRKWQQRGSLDSVYLANLMAHSALTGQALDLNKFIVPVAEAEFKRPRKTLAGRAATTRRTPRKGAEC